MKNKFIILTFSIFLILQTSNTLAEEIPKEDSLTDIPSIEEISEERHVNRLDEDSENMLSNSTSLSTKMPHKEPISKKRLVKKFLMAMAAVGVSSIALYTGLTLYNKLRCYTPESVNNQADIDTKLSSPKNYEDAVKVFIDKTKWQG